MNSVLGIALWHIKHGYSIFPLPRGGKFDPTFKWGVYAERMPTEAEVREWFSTEKNYAVIGGKISGGLTILDFDDPSLIPLVIDASIEKLIEEKEVRIVKSAHGYHIYLRDKNGNGMPNKNLRVPSKTDKSGFDPYCSLPIDIKSEMGYVVGPGSLHPSGVQYELVSDVDPKPINVSAVFERMIIPNLRNLVLCRIIDQYYVPGKRYELTLALGAYLRLVMDWSTDRIKRFFDYHDRYLSLNGKEKHRPSTIRWLINLLERTEKHDLVVGKGLPDDCIKTIEKYAHYINGDELIRGQSPVETKGKTTAVGNEIQIWFDESNGVRLASGNLYKLTVSKRGVTDKLLFHGPFDLLGVVRYDDQWKIRYLFDGEENIRLIKDTVSHVSVLLKTTRETNNIFSEFLYAYLMEQRSKNDFTVMHSPIFVENDVIMVGYDIGKIDTARNLRALRDFYEISANPHAFLSAMSCALIAPLSYEIRKRAPVGYLLPTHVSHGRTGGAKTSTDAIFVVTGYAQKKEEGILVNESVATPFTMQRNLGDSILPVIINDVGPDWLDKMGTIIKNASENPIAGQRGNPDQTVTERDVRRFMFITLNQSISPEDDAARNRRYVLEAYTDTNQQRQDRKAYREFMAKLQPGFMYAIFSEVFAGRSITEVTNEIAETDSVVDFVNYGLKHINNLCKKYDIPLMPVYAMVEDNTSESYAERFAEILIDLNSQMQHGNSVGYLLNAISNQYLIRGKGDGRTYEIWFQSNVYEKIIKDLKLEFPHRRTVEMINNTVSTDRIKILNGGKRKNIRMGDMVRSCYGMEYRMPKEDIPPEEKRLLY